MHQQFTSSFPSQAQNHLLKNSDLLDGDNDTVSGHWIIHKINVLPIHLLFFIWRSH